MDSDFLQSVVAEYFLTLRDGHDEFPFSYNTETQELVGVADDFRFKVNFVEIDLIS